MPDARNEITSAVARLRRRSAAVAFVRYGAKAAFWCGVLCAVALIFVPEGARAWTALGAAAAALAAGAAWAAARRPGAAAVAKLYDDVEGLKDRVSSAVQLAGERSGMVEALVEDTAARVRALRPAAAFPVVVPREGWLLPLPIAAAVAVVLLQGWWRVDPTPDPRLEEVLSEQAAAIAELVSRERAKEPTPRERELLERLEELQQLLSREDLKKKDALAEIAKLMDELDRQEDAEAERKKKLAELQEQLKKDPANKSISEDLDEGDLEEAEKKLRDKLEELQEELERLREELERKMADGASPEELEELRKALQELSEQMAGMKEMLGLLEELKGLEGMQGLEMEALECLGQCEGELAGLSDAEIVDARFFRIGQCLGNGAGELDGPILRIPRRLVDKASTKAGRGTVEEIFGEETANEHARDEQKVTVRQDEEGRSVYTQVQVANDGSETNLGAREVYLSERRAAEDTIQRQDVPAGYREYVRRYFDGIQPGEETSAGGQGEDDR